MSVSKRYLFDPATAAERQRTAEATLTAYQHRIPAKRKNRVSATLHWDSLWEGAIHSAAAELGVRHIRVNDGICFERQAERDQVKKRAEVLWQERHDQYAALSRNRP